MMEEFPSGQRYRQILNVVIGIHLLTLKFGTHVMNTEMILSQEKFDKAKTFRPKEVAEVGIFEIVSHNYTYWQILIHFFFYCGHIELEIKHTRNQHKDGLMSKMSQGKTKKCNPWKCLKVGQE